ncbi:autotransporter outer membrane beta-barrel domain-containing protein [Ketobacter sp.]
MQPFSTAMRFPLGPVASGIIVWLGILSTNSAVANELPSLHTVLLHNSDIQEKSISRHLNDLRHGTALHKTQSTDAATTTDGDRISLFLTTSRSEGEQDTTDLETGYDAEGHHSTAAADFRINQEWLAGIAYGYSESELNYYSNDPTNSTTVDSESDFVTLYSSWYRRDFAVDMGLGYSDTQFSTQRTIAGVDTIGDTGSRLFSLHLSGAFDFYYQGLTYGPLAALDMLNGHIDAYTEQVAGIGVAQLKEQDVRSAILSMGAQAAYAQHFSWGALVPQIKGIARYQIENDQRQIYGGYALNPGQTVVFPADKPDTTWFEFSVGLSAVLSRGISFYLHYEAVVDYSATSLQTASAGIRADF